MKKLFVAAFLLLAAPALAQTIKNPVQQSGNVTRNHVPIWITSGVIADGGSAADSPITSFGVTNNGGAGICVSSDRQTAAGRNQLCLGASTTSAATISLQNYGTASPQSIQFVVNGAVQGFPTVSPLPVGVNNPACFSNTAGGLKDCGGVFPSGMTIPSPIISAPSISGVAAFSGQLIETGTSPPASAAGNTVMMGTIASPTLTNTGQAFLYNTVVNGAIIQGDGSTNDYSVFNKSGTLVFGVPTGTTKLNFPSLASGTCVSGIGLDSGNNIVLVACPQTASSIQVGVTNVTSGASGSIEFNNAGVLGELVANGGITKSGSNLQADGNFGGWALQNCTLAASVGSSLLTVALKDNAGNDPSATSPCSINYRNVAAATGSTTLVQQTAALSMTTNAVGATLGSANSTAFRFWAVAFNNGGTNVLALFNASTSTQCFPINEGAVATSTPISGSATSAGVFYTPNGTTVTSKSFRILGYVEYNSTGLATAGTYASGPNFIQVFGSGIRKPCEPVQVSDPGTVTATTALQTANTQTAVNSALTPTSAANLMHVDAVVGIGTISANTIAGPMQLSRGAGPTLIGNIQSFGSGSLNNGGWQATLHATDKPNTTSSITYYVYGEASSNNAATVNGTTSGVSNSSTITITEIMG